MTTVLQQKNVPHHQWSRKTMTSLVAATALFACNCPAALGANTALSPPSQPAVPTLGVTQTPPVGTSLTNKQEVKNSIEKKAELRAAFKEERQKDNGLGIVAGVCVIVACGAFISKIFKTGRGAVGSWILSGVNDGLALVVATITDVKAHGIFEGLKSTLGSGAGLWLGSVLGVGAVAFVAWKKCGWKALDGFERTAIGASVGGWAILTANTENVLLCTVISQAINVTAGALFMRYQYRDPKSVPLMGQALFLVGSLTNAYAMTGFEAKDIVLTVGSYLTSTLCVIGVATGHVRDWLKRRAGKRMKNSLSGE